MDPILKSESKLSSAVSTIRTKDLLSFLDKIQIFVSSEQLIIIALKSLIFRNERNIQPSLNRIHLFTLNLVSYKNSSVVHEYLSRAMP